MSYQPPGAIPPPVAPAPPPSQPGRRRGGLIGLGIAVLLIGVVAGIVLIASSSSMEDDAVEDLARAPVNCTTTLEVDSPSTFLVFVETKGKLDELDGGCAADAQEYSHSASRLPTVDLTLTDDDGEELDLDRRTDVSYDTGDFRGESVREVRIEAKGDYQLTVRSPADDVAIAVGDDPNGVGDSTRVAGLIVLIAGAVIGAVLIALGARRRPATPGAQPLATGMAMAPPSPTAAYPTVPSPAPPMRPPSGPFAPPPPPGSPPPAPRPPDHDPWQGPATG